MSEQNFKQKQQSAIEQMREMNRRSQDSQQTHEEKAKPHIPSQKNLSFLEGLGLPFLDNLKTDGDLTLILGVLLLLLSEKADKRLLFALIYILL